MLRRVTDWHLGLYLITVLAFGWRVFSVLHWYPHPYVWGDAFYYHGAANLLVEGHGFVNPFTYAVHHRLVPSEDFPPLFTLYLAAASAVGAKSFFAHQIWCCVLGAATVPVVGLAGREAGGPAVGMMAAAIAAFYPNFWIPNGQVLSETLAMFMTAVVLLCALRFWRRPRLLGAAGLGVAIGLAALARDELLSLLVLLALPLALLARQGYYGPRPWSQPPPTGPRLAASLRWKMAGLACLCAAVVIAPWSAYNATRFQRFELISAGLGETLAVTNCHTTYYGTLTGYWSLPCAERHAPPAGDDSVQDYFLRHQALSYAKAHLSRLPAVGLARLGRTFGLYAPIQQVNLDVFIEHRPKRPAFVGLFSYWVLAALSVGGALALRSRGVRLLPFGAVAAATALTSLVAFGQTRYRAPFEVVLAVLAPAALEWVWSRWRPPEEEDQDSVELGWPEPAEADSPTGELRPAAQPGPLSLAT